MPLEEIKLSGLQALLCDEQIPLDAALDATNCYVDDGAIRGRNGYRAVTSGAIGSGTVQGIWRYRPTPTSARTVVVRGGAIYLVTDPSSETASDGVATLLGTPFGSTANISAVQLGKDLYLCSDESTTIWRRIKPDYTLDSITALPVPVAPTASAGSALAFTLFSSLAAPTLAGGLTSSASSVTNWTQLQGTVGGTATYDFGSTLDWTAIEWLFVACSPETSSGGGNQFRIELGNNAGTYATIGTMYDTPGGGSPYVVFASLQGVDATIKGSARHLRFTQLGPKTDPFCVSGYMPLPTAPSQGGDIPYYSSYFNSVTGQESGLSPVTTVTYNSASVVFPSFHAGRWMYNNFIDVGAGVSSNPDSFANDAIFNKTGGLTTPTASQFSLIQTFSGSLPAAAQYPAADTVRLWRQEGDGIRLVKCSVYTTRADGSAWTSGTNTISDLPAGATYWGGGGTTWSITDDTGDATLSHLGYKAGGTPPPANAVAAVAGRLVAGGDPSNPQRETVSSFAPFASTTDPFPQFPPISLITADGWAFDIAPTASEQILWQGNGDNALYTLTNECAYVQTTMDPQATPYQIFARGAIGRRAGIWSERSVFWTAHDGIYIAENRTGFKELTADIRRLFRSWFQPDSTVVMAYQDRKLYAIRGTRMLRYDFVLNQWTRHTLAHTMLHAACWRDPNGIYQQFWMLASNGNVYRWQPGLYDFDSNRATSDAGTAISPWTYSTGFSLKAVFQPGIGYGDKKSRVRSVFLDTAGDTVTVSLYRDATSSPTRYKTFAIGEHQLPMANDLTAYKWRIGLAANSSSTAIRRAMFEREVIDGEGA